MPFVTEVSVRAPVIDAVVARGHSAFPVVRDGRVVGVVTKNGILRALTDVGRNSRVQDAMSDRFEMADPSEMLEGALARLEAKGGEAIVVTQNGAILGMVTAHTVGELLTMREAARVRA